MEPNYCLPIITADQDEVLEAINTGMEDYRYFEVWLDYVETADETFVNGLVDKLGDRLIVLFRRQNLEAPRMDIDKRLALLDLLGGTPALVDLDVPTQQAELDHVKESELQINLVASYHDYEQTPDTLQLRGIIDTMDAYRPAVYKLSTLCRSEDDAIRLLGMLSELKAKGVRYVVSGMGGYGVVTRVFGTLWGNEMVFAPRSKDERSAEGQLTRQQLESIFKELDG
jgi:3-dehydroquinate dehydratase type I